MLSTEQKLIEAVVNGNLEEVKHLISNGVDINTRCSEFFDEERQVAFDGDTPLHIAAHFGHLNIMEYLINKGADLSVRCNAGNTPLANTIIANQFKAFEFLIAKGADIESKNQKGDTALHMAFIYGRENMISALMEMDIKDINKQNDNGQTVLYRMARDDKYEIVELLLQKGADPNIPNINGYTPLLATIINGRKNEESLKLLLEDERTDLNIKSKKGECFVSIVLDGSYQFSHSSTCVGTLEYHLKKNYHRLNDESQKIFERNPGALYSLFELSISKENFDKAKELFFKLPLNNEVYKSIFLNRYPCLPTFYAMQKRNDNLQEINNLLIKKVPSDFLCGKVPKNSLGYWPYIDFIFSYAQNVIPQLLETISESCRDGIFIKKEEVAGIDWQISNIKKEGKPYIGDCAAYSCSNKNSDYYDARKAIEKYCEKNIDGKYYIIPCYLFPINGSPYFKELKQHFKDIYNAINFNDLSKVKKSLELIKADIYKPDMDINAINRALNVLVKEAKSNENIARLISDFQADITFPKQCLENVDLSANSGKGVERKR